MSLRAPRESGFTLLELLAVIVLVSIAAVVLTAGLGSGMQSAKTRSALATMVASLNQARVQAISQGQPVRATFDLEAGQVSLPGQRFDPWPADFDVQLHTARHLGAAFAFYPDGASSGGHILVRQDTRRWRIDIAWLTGRTTLEVLP